MSKSQANAFSTAQVVDTSAKAKKSNQGTTEVAGLERLAAIRSTIKALEAMDVASTAEIYGYMLERFTQEGISKRAKPESFDAVEGDATGNLQCRKRGTNSPLKEHEESILEENKIEVETMNDEFFVNPKYYADAAIMEKAGTAITKAGMPADFIQRKAGKRVVTERSISDLFSGAHSPAEVRAMLPLVCTMGIRPKLDPLTLNKHVTALVADIVKTIATVGDDEDKKTSYRRK